MYDVIDLCSLHRQNGVVIAVCVNRSYLSARDFWKLSTNS